MRRQLEDVVRRSNFGLTSSAALAAALALWSSSTAVQQTMRATNVAYGEDETRSVVRLRLYSLAAASSVIVLLVGGFFIAGLLPTALDAFGLERGSVRSVMDFLRWPALGLGMFASCAALYRLGPDRARARWPWISWGATIASGMWLVGSLGFSAQAGRLGRYNSASGTMSGVVVTLGWLFLTAFVVLLGARINAELERQTVRDTTVGDVRLVGEREAAAADDADVDRP